jgi:excisionase family DNA binding protein
MQAYANAKFSPPTSRFEHAHVPLLEQAVDVGLSTAATTRFDSAASPSSILMSLILHGLDDRELAVLARRLMPHLQYEGDPEPVRLHTAYTVSSLAAELGVSQKAIRCAIARRELAAVKRGARWIISAEAVRTWATASDARSRTSRPRTAAAPKAAGPSLRSVLCGAGSHGGAR